MSPYSRRMKERKVDLCPLYCGTSHSANFVVNTQEFLLLFGGSLQSDFSQSLLVLVFNYPVAAEYSLCFLEG